MQLYFFLQLSTHLQPALDYSAWFATPPPRPLRALLPLFPLPIPSSLLPSYSLLQLLYPGYRVRNPLSPARLPGGIHFKVRWLTPVANRRHFKHDRRRQPRNGLGSACFAPCQECVQPHFGRTPLRVVPAVVRRRNRLGRRWPTFPRSR